MNSASKRALVSSIWRQLQARTLSSASDVLRPGGPTESLKQKVAATEARRRKSKPYQLIFVRVPESLTYLDTTSKPMIITFIGITIGAKILYEYEYSDDKVQERIEKRIRDSPEGTGTVRMLSREEWESVREVRPRTPFESSFSRPDSRIRTGEPLSKEDVKDWAIDVITDALTRVEENVRDES